MSTIPLLREAAELKIAEFDQWKSDFDTRYGIGNPQSNDVALRERVDNLVRVIKLFDSHLEHDEDLTIIACHVEQAETDTCLSNDKLRKFEEQLLDKLHKQRNRYEATSFHLDLMKEAMDASQASMASSSAKSESTDSEDGFDIIDNGLEELLEKFEGETFIGKDVDAEALEEYLATLMGAKDSCALNTLRNGMRRYGEDILDGDVEIDEEDLQWCIVDLLKNDLINSERREVLQGYIQNSVALKELLSILNMRSIRHWNWNNADKGLPVTTRQDSEGRIHITVEEDLVDMLFLHCNAIGWAQKLKDCMEDFMRSNPVVDRQRLSHDEQRKRDFFLEMMPLEPLTDEEGYPPAPLPPPPPPPMCHLRGVYVLPVRPLKKKKQGNKYPKVLPPPPPLPPQIITLPPPPPPSLPPLPPYFHLPPMPMFSYEVLDEKRRRTYLHDFFMARLPSQDGCRPKITAFEKVQANLIRTLAAEMKIRDAFGGQCSCLAMEVQSLASTLQHQTVLVILKFLGIPETFLDFFARFLAAELNLGPSVRGTPDRILARACGVPGQHGMELLFTEAVMFFAELAVEKKTGAHLYRIEDKCYFVGTEKQRQECEQELSRFSNHTKIDFNDVSTGFEQFDIGCLELTANTVGINHSMVEDYAHRAKKQLSAQTAVYDWVTVWNKTIGTYGAHLFGPLIQLFGKSHLEAVKTAYQQIFDIVFEGSNLTEHLGHLLRTRSDFARTCPPLALEAMMYLPQAFGGLGVKNPFITLSLAREMSAGPNALIQEYLDVESTYYNAALRNWSNVEPAHISKKLSSIFQNNNEAIAAALGTDCAVGTFFSKEDLTKHREHTLFPCIPPTLLHPAPASHAPTPIPYLVGLYQALLTEPVDEILASERVIDNVREFSTSKRWNQLRPEDKWVLQMYGDDCFERYGTLEMWCEKYIPRYCMTIVRGDFWDGDVDDSSYCSSSSIA